MATKFEADRYNSICFDYQTTNRTDYQPYKLKGYPKTVYQARPSRYVRKKPEPKNLESMFLYKHNIPFDLLWKPKEIVRTNPHDAQKPYEKPIDVDREAVQLSRPRLVMTPAVAIDDVEAEKRRILIVDTYISTATIAAREAVAPIKDVKAPLPQHPACANPIRLRQYQPPLVSPEWRMPSVTWDDRQLRSYVDPTKEFWLRKTPNTPV